MDKLLSIVVPTYNMEKYLDKCLTSLIIDDKELMMRLEVIVVIDGANDRSSEIAHRYHDIYPNTFIVIDKENGNYGSCINRGLKEAKGKYIKVLDADDHFDTESFYIFLKSISRLKNEPDVIFSGYCTTDEDGNCGIPFIRDINKYVILSTDDIKNSVTQGRHVAMHEITYRTDMLRQNGYTQTEGISYTDQEWILYPMAYAQKFYCINVVIYKYLVGRAGQSMDLNILKRGVPALISISRRMLNWYSSCDKNSIQNTDYLHHNIVWHLNHLYSLCLLIDVNGVYLSNLKEFDDQLLLINNSIYKELNNLKTIFLIKSQIRFIKSWRNITDQTKLPWALSFRNRVHHIIQKRMQ